VLHGKADPAARITGGKKPNTSRQHWSRFARALIVLDDQRLNKFD
jgi:hypothetical protein